MCSWPTGLVLGRAELMSKWMLNHFAELVRLNLNVAQINMLLRSKPYFFHGPYIVFENFKLP